MFRKKIIKNEWIRNWCLIPVHAWLKDEQEWLSLFAEFWAKLPQVAFEEAFSKKEVLIVLPPVEVSRIIEISSQTHAVLQLDKSLLSRPRVEALAILAHEIAHLCENQEIQADKLAAQWGFLEGLKQALKRDFEEGHPRRQALLGF